MNKPIEITPKKMMLLGLGWFGFQFFWGFHTVSMPLFLRNFTASKFVISSVLSLAGVAGCIIPPITGYLSDRTSGRFGRRRPYIFFGLIGAFICLFCLPQAVVFVPAAIISGLMYFSLRIAETPYLSLLPDTTPAEQRSTASGVMNLCGSIGLIFYFIIGSIVWEKNPFGTFYMVAIVFLGTVLLTLALIREPKAPMEAVAAGSGPWDYLKSIVKETDVLKYFIAQFFWWFGFWMVSAFAALFVVEELGVAEGKAYDVLMWFSIVATLCVLPLGMLGDRFGRKGILTLMVGLWAVSEIVVGLSQTLMQAKITVAVTAIPFAAIMGVGLAYLFDLIPEERTAEFVGFSVISVAVAQIFGPLLGGKLIDTLGYRSIFPAAAILMIIGLILLQFVRPRQNTKTSTED